jgi:hypothetical protein
MGLNIFSGKNFAIPSELTGSYNSRYGYVIFCIKVNPYIHFSSELFMDLDDEHEDGINQNIFLI